MTTTINVLDERTLELSEFRTKQVIVRTKGNLTALNVVKVMERNPAYCPTILKSVESDIIKISEGFTVFRLNKN